MNIVNVGDISTQIRGVSYKKADARNEPGPGFVPVLRANNIVDGEIDLTELVYVPQDKVSRKQYLKKGDILIAASSGSLSVVGKAATVRLDLDAGFGAFCKILRPNEKVYAPYFANYFQTRHYRHIVSNLAAGANINNLRNEHLDDLAIPLPPLAEQQRIAAILDQADALRAKRRAALAKLDTLLQATFLHMFGDPVTNPMGWEVRHLEDLCSKIVDCLHTTPKYAEPDPQFACVRSSDIQNGYFDWSSTKYVGQKEYEERVERAIPIEGDVVYCREGARFGNAARILGEKQICLGQRTMLFRPEANIATSEFIWRYLESEGTYYQTVKLVGGSASPHVNIRDIRKFKVGLPPLEAQQEFSQIVKKIDCQRMAQTRNLQTFDNLFHSLQQRAFKGEL